MALKKFREEFAKKGEEVIKIFKEKIIGIRGGRPDPSLVEFILVEAYERKMPLRELASIGVNPPNQIVVQVWDEGIIGAVKKAIESSDLNVVPQVEGKIIRLNFPALTQERREELLKILSKKKEEARIHLRNVRHQVLKELEEIFEEGHISEDEMFREKERIQEEVEGLNERIEEIAKNKEKEILEY